MLTFSRRVPVIDSLRSVLEFRGLSRSQLQEIGRLAEHVTVEKGKVLVEEGRFGTEFFLILTGTVEVTNRARLLSRLGSGDFFGELAALNRGRRNATVTALTDVEVLVIGRRQHNAILNIPEFRDGLLKTMASRLQIVDALLSEWEQSLAPPDAVAEARDVGPEYREHADDRKREVAAWSG